MVAPVEQPNRPELSAREIEIALGVMAGRTTEEIGDDLDLGFESVRSYMNRLRRKTGLRRKPQLAVWATAEEPWLRHRLKRLQDEKRKKKKEAANGATKRRV